MTQAPGVSPAADAAFKLGMAMATAGRWRIAASGLLLAARLGDRRSIVLRGVGECARQLAGAKVSAPAYGLAPARAPGDISVIVCSITPAKLARLERNLAERLRADTWELIHVGDARSLAEGYMRGYRRARGELLVFCHDDIHILSPDFGDKLRAHLADHDLIGVAGTTLAGGPDWAWSGTPYAHNLVSQPHFDPRQREQRITFLMGARGPVVADAQMLDGLFLAMRRDLVERIGFDASTFDGFHFYDLDFSYRAFRSGARTAICTDIALFHESAGNFDATHAKYARRFCAKLPQACAMRTPPPRDIAWMPMADSTGTLLEELAWMNHFTSRTDDELRAQARSAVLR